MRDTFFAANEETTAPVRSPKPSPSPDPTPEKPRPSPTVVEDISPEPEITPTPEASPFEEIPTEVEPTEELPDPVGDEAPYVAFPKTGPVLVSSACQFESEDGPAFFATLENGGVLELEIFPGQVLHAGAQQVADGLEFRTAAPSDTSYTHQDGWIDGVSQMWSDNGNRSITVEYHVLWDDGLPECSG
jgi:hypothetical protein